MADADAILGPVADFALIADIDPNRHRASRVLRIEPAVPVMLVGRPQRTTTAIGEKRQGKYPSGEVGPGTSIGCTTSGGA